MAKISLGLLFALVVVPLHSVLCDEDAWMSVLTEAKNEAAKAGVSQDTILEAQKSIEDGTAGKVAEDALGGSLNDWVQQANDVVNGDGSSGLPIDLTPDDEDEDNLSEAPESTPTAPARAPTTAPTKAPTSAPTQAPSPQAQTQSSATI